jgi:ferredoxin
LTAVNSSRSYRQIEQHHVLLAWASITGGAYTLHSTGRCVLVWLCMCAVWIVCRTFAMEEDYGRARAMQQGIDSDEKLQEAIDTCPVNCIHWVST